MLIFDPTQLAPKCAPPHQSNWFPGIDWSARSRDVAGCPLYPPSLTSRPTSATGTPQPGCLALSLHPMSWLATKSNQPSTDLWKLGIILLVSTRVSFSVCLLPTMTYNEAFAEMEWVS